VTRRVLDDGSSYMPVRDSATTLRPATARERPRRSNRRSTPCPDCRAAERGRRDPGPWDPCRLGNLTPRCAQVGPRCTDRGRQKRELGALSVSARRPPPLPAGSCGKRTGRGAQKTAPRPGLVFSPGPRSRRMESIR
jgi:hypothetical protein